MLKRKTTAVLPVTLTLKGQGETIKFKVEFHNRTASELTALLEENSAEVNAGLQTVLAIVKSWDAEYELSIAGLTEAEDERPGIVIALLEAFYAARRMTREKN